jgi:hypothetical protein
LTDGSRHACASLKTTAKLVIYHVPASAHPPSVSL